MDEGTVAVVLQYLDSTSGDVTTVVVLLQYLHNISREVAAVAVLCNCTTLQEVLLLCLLYSRDYTIVQQM